jgi:hypothetical protein
MDDGGDFALALHVGVRHLDVQAFTAGWVSGYRRLELNEESFLPDRRPFYAISQFVREYFNDQRRYRADLQSTDPH